MRVLFLDKDGVMTDHNMEEYDLKHFRENIDKLFPYDDKFKILKAITDKYGLMVVISASMKLGFEKEYQITEDSYIYNFIGLLKKYNIPYYGITPSIKNPGPAHGQEMWKDYDIQAYLIEHPEVTEYVIIDDNLENDINFLKPHLIKTEYNEDGKGNGGLLPHHIEDVSEKLKPRETYTPEEMEENELYKRIKYSEFNFIDCGTSGLFIKGDEYIINVQLTYDKKTVIYHWYDEDDDKRGVFHSYEEVLSLLSYFGLVKKEIDEKTLKRRC